jgi:hypothetical protein
MQKGERMNKADRLAEYIKQDLEAAIVHVKNAEKAAVESSQPYKTKIINELIEAEMKLAKTMNAVVTGEIKAPDYGNKRGGAENDRN